MEAGTADLILDLQRQRRENQDLDRILEERTKMLESLFPRKCELQNELQRLKETCTEFDKLHKEEDAAKVVAKAERERKERTQIEADIKRLNEEYAELITRKQELQHQEQRHAPYLDIMQQAVKMTTFEDVRPFTDHLENLLYYKEQLDQRWNEGEEKADQMRKTQLTLENHHRLQHLHQNNQLSQLQTELEKTRSEVLTWEKNWNHIQETAAKKTLLLGQIKIAILNVYERTIGDVEEESVDINDTEKQLEKVKMFFKDHEDIVKHYQTPAAQQNDVRKRHKVKKSTPTDCPNN